MSLNTSPALGVDALWSLCLALVKERRAGAAFSDLHGAGGLRWQGEGGWALGAGWDAQATELFALLKPLLDRPAGSPAWAVGQLGQSLNGCIATRGGDANYVNGEEVLTHLHRLRALCDAVIIGAATAAIDNPQLTTRRVEGAHPVRVLLDPALGLSPQLRVFEDGQAPTLLVCDARQAAQAADRVGREQVLGVPGLLGDDGGAMRVRPLLDALAERGLRVLFVEGGGVTVSRFMQQDALDRLHLSIAPVIIGDGRPGLALPAAALMRDCPRPSARVFRFGADVLWDLDLRAGCD
ncbi:RibD family protein [Variovorax sp. OV329]|uniref:RibD family protein n=1 Tax=Variovorax sp. OV329 TaxID=1882825 RepID=UPI0008F1FF6E|nr:RibD family protein [Variovorax sp. OV329]SFN03665.1 riboflavin-specific deaminase C-terminal domain-containing protein [Variovorax sp. OV329]